MAAPQPPPYPGYPPAYPQQPYYGPPPQAPGPYPPPYYGMPPYPPFMPPPKKDSSAIAIVIVVVLVLVASTVVVAAVLYVMVAGLTAAPQQFTPTITLAPERWANDNLTIRIAAVSSPPFAAENLTFIVRTTTGQICYSGRSNDPAQTSCAGASVNVTYFDFQGEGVVDALDTIRILASPRTPVQGGTLGVLLGADVIGTTTLPG